MITLFRGLGRLKYLKTEKENVLPFLNFQIPIWLPKSGDRHRQTADQAWSVGQSVAVRTARVSPEEPCALLASHVSVQTTQIVPSAKGWIQARTSHKRLVFCQFKQKTDNNPPFFLHKSYFF